MEPVLLATHTALMDDDQLFLIEFRDELRRDLLAMLARYGPSDFFRDAGLSIARADQLRNRDAWRAFQLLCTAREDISFGIGYALRGWPGAWRVLESIQLRYRGLREDEIGEDWLTPWQTAKVLRLSDESIRRLCDAGELDCFRTVGGHRRIGRRSVVAAIATRRTR